MILLAESWQAAAISSGLLAPVLFPILSAVEKQPWYGHLLVQKSPGEVKKSMLLLLIMFAAVTSVAWGCFDQPALAAAAILMWGTGDAAAALIGIPFGKHKVRCRPADGKKSWEGSFAMLLVSFAAGLPVLLLSANSGLPKTLLLAGAGALAGTVTELFSPSEYDTITVPVAVVAVLLALEMI